MDEVDGMSGSGKIYNNFLLNLRRKNNNIL